MMNPFSGYNHTVEEPKELFGRDRDLQKIQGRVKNRTDLLLMGPEGVGKTSLLRCAITSSFRREMARDRRILVTRPFEFPATLERDRVFGFLIEQIRSTLSSLPTMQDRRGLNNMIHEQVEFQDDQGERFKAVINTLFEDYGYKVTLVMDNFESFTSSPDVTMEQHGIMRDMLEKDYLRFIVSTNYDLSEDSLPPGIRGSYLIQKFMGFEHYLEPLKLSEASKALRHNEECKWLTDDLISHIHALSGGIPGLLLRAATNLYEVVENNNGKLPTEEDWGVIDDETYKDSIYILKHWGQMLPQRLVECLQEIAANQGIVTKTGAADILVQRGLIIPQAGSSYSFINPLWYRYIKEGNVHASDFHMLNQAIKEEEQSTAQTPITETVLREVVRQLLDSYRKQPFLDVPPTDEELKIEETTVQKIERCFDEYRQCHPDILDEAVFQRIGDECRTDLKAAIFLDIDHSFPRAALNAYGVVLEARLRECLYDLFHIHSDLCLIGDTPFSTLRREKAMIGSFRYVLNDGACLEVLTQCCADNQMEQYNLEWWSDLRSALNTAGNLRNKADHPSPVTQEQVDQMRLCLLEESQLLIKLEIGRTLYSCLCGNVPRVDSMRYHEVQGKVLAFRCVEVTARGSLRGVLLPNNFGASISPRKVRNAVSLDQIPCSLKDLVGEEWVIDVSVDDYDENGEVLLVTPVSCARHP